MSRAIERDRQLLIDLLRGFYGNTDHVNGYVTQIKSGQWDDEALLTTIRLYREEISPPLSPSDDPGGARGEM